MTRGLAALAATAMLTLGVPASAQDMPGMPGMPGMKMPAPAKKPVTAKPVKKPAATKPAPRPAARRVRAAARAPAPSAMPGMAMPAAKPDSTPPMAAMPGMQDKPADGAPAVPQAPQSMPGMDMSGTAKPDMSQTGTALPAGDAPAPAPPMDFYADRYFPASDMSRSRAAMMREQGGQTLYQVMFNIAEIQARPGRNGYRWDGEAWVGGDINRLWVTSEGDGVLSGGVERAEVQALYSRAVGPYFNLQAGVRHDFQPARSRTYATIGFKGLAPYMFEVDGALFLSPNGEVRGRLAGYYDQRLTQRLILQPRVEFNFSAQDVPRIRLGSGLSDVELDLRLRYDVSRKFSPYIGVSYDAKVGRTADFARADGKDPSTTSLVAGVRIWF